MNDEISSKELIEERKFKDDPLKELLSGLEVHELNEIGKSQISMCSPKKKIR